VPRTRQDFDDEVLAFVRRGYELWNAGDLNTVSQMWSDDFEFHTAPEWPGIRVVHGREAAVRFLTDEIAAVIELSDIEVVGIERIGDEMVIEMVAHTRGHESHVDIGKVPIFHVTRLRDGRVCRVRAFLDGTQARAAARAG
jgi:ketosteroid isomerase-like protein